MKEGDRCGRALRWKKGGNFPASATPTPIPWRRKHPLNVLLVKRRRSFSCRNGAVPLLSRMPPRRDISVPQPAPPCMEGRLRHPCPSARRRRFNQPRAFLIAAPCYASIPGRRRERWSLFFIYPGDVAGGAVPPERRDADPSIASRRNNETVRRGRYAVKES